MNISSFNETIYDIEQQIEIAKSRLDEEVKFPFERRIIFNNILNDLLTFIGKDQALNKLDTTWHAMHRFVKLKKLHQKIDLMRSKIINVCPKKPYFARKIKSQVLPLIDAKLNELRLKITSQERLPFDAGLKREEFHKNVKEILLLQNTEDQSRVAKEYFHFLADRVNQKKLKTINLDDYSGNLEIYSLESWMQILSDFIKEGNSSDKIKGEKILSIMAKSLNFTVKSSYAYDSDYTYVKDEQNELNYFENLMKSSFPKEKLASLPDEKREEFLKKFQLETENSVPRMILINEIAWDLVDAVKQLQTGESLLLPVGTSKHSIVVQLSCIKASLDSEEGNYQYKIFNTGTGVYMHHQSDSSLKFAYPLIFEDLKGRVFSNSFFAEIVRMSLEETDVSHFYALHEKHLEKEGNGIKHKNKGSLYFIQKNEICSYASVCAWINSFLTKKQQKKLELIKTKIAIRKQTEVVKSLTVKVQEFEQRTKEKEKKDTSSVPPSFPRNKLKENKLLLHLGKNYLKGLQLPPIANRTLA